MATYNCEVCDSEFSKSSYYRNHGFARFCSKACANVWQRSRTDKIRGPEHHTYIASGRTIRYTRDGPRIFVRSPITGRFRKEYQVVAERALGRLLYGDEVVHHINCDQTDNRPENLLVCTQGFHTWLHAEYSRRFGQMMFGKKEVEKESNGPQ